MESQETEGHKQFLGPDAMRPKYEVRYSRWKKSPTTFGPLGRIVATLLLVVLPIAIWVLFLGFLGLVFAAICFILCVPLVRSIWKKTHIPQR